MAKLTIAMLQRRPAAGPIGSVVADLKARMSEAAAASADILVLPETFLTGYGDTPRTRELAQDLDSPAIAEIRDHAARLSLGVVLSFPERAEGQIFNSAAMISATGEVVDVHRKTVLANAHERECYARGTKGLAVFEVCGVRCAILICYEVELPECVRNATLLGADLVIVPTALGPRWRIVSDTVIPTRAYENGIFVAYCNYPADGSGEFVGQSRICGPDGQALLAPTGRPGLLLATIDTARIAAQRAELDFLGKCAGRTGQPVAVRLTVAIPAGAHRMTLHGRMVRRGAGSFEIPGKDDR